MNKRQQESLASTDPYEAQIRVRYAECDAMGLLHHAKYWEYFEEVRTHLLRDRGTRYRDLEAQGVFFVVYKCMCVYRQPIRYDDVVTVRTWVTRITRTRVDHAYQIDRDGLTCCEATTTLACVDREGKPMVMPEHMWPDV
ncbi:MAG: acyl-CoA thioesterase [Phycisphaerae bacterium]